MRVSFRQANFEELAQLWNSCYPEKLHLSALDLEGNTVKSPTFDWGASCLFVDDDTGKTTGFAAVKRSAQKICRQGDPDEAHLCAFVYRSPDTGVDLVAFVKNVLRSRGAYLLHFGNDYHYILPGCPQETTQLHQFLVIEGFQEIRSMYDMELELSSYAAPPKTVPGDVRPLRQEDLSVLKGFLHAEFAGRTAHEVVLKVQEEGRADFAYGMYDGGHLVGFAMVQDATHYAKHRAALFGASMGDDWCTVGPLGVVGRDRGRMHSLLAGLMPLLRESGKKLCVIGNVASPEPYAKHGFGQRNVYKEMSLRLDDPGPAQRLSV